MIDLPGSRSSGGALVIGRGGANTDAEYFEDLADVLDALRETRNRVRVLFLEAADDVLIRRYEGTRRRHPIDARGVKESIADERRLLEAGARPGRPVDRTPAISTRISCARGSSRPSTRTAVTPTWSPRWCRSATSTASLSMSTLSSTVDSSPILFGSRNCVPSAVSTKPVREYVLGKSDSQEFLDRVDDLLRAILPAFVREGKSYLTIAMAVPGVVTVRWPWPRPWPSASCRQDTRRRSFIATWTSERRQVSADKRRGQVRTDT